MNILNLVIIALIGESIWETVKMLWQEGKISIDKIGALIVGLLLAVGAGFDLFEMIEMPLQIPYLGMVLTGILISRGANFIHDLLGKINQSYQDDK